MTGGGVIAEVTPGWKEPVVLWQVLVGAPSSGKSPALAATRRLLGPIEADLRLLMVNVSVYMRPKSSRRGCSPTSGGASARLPLNVECLPQ